MYPLFSPQPQRPGNLFTHLAAQPAKRVPFVTARFNNSKPQNQVSFLMQATGDAVPEHEVCGRCSNMSGVFREACVVVREPAVIAITGGACANCWYGRQGSLCSFRSPAPAHHQSAQAADPGIEAPVPVPPIPPPFQPAAMPLADVPAPAPAPIHPSYAAALAAGAVAVTPTPVAPSNNGLTGSGNLSRDDKVRLWENRYDKLSTDNLLRAHEHLAEWQEDLTTRLMAMNRVVLMRLKQTEGYIHQ
jgi:hypothetical protein